MNVPPFPGSGMPIPFHGRVDPRYEMPIPSYPFPYPWPPVWGPFGVSATSYVPFREFSPLVPHPHFQKPSPSPGRKKEKEVPPSYQPLWDSPESPESPWIRT